jgi:hypothetical protein
MSEIAERRQKLIRYNKIQFEISVLPIQHENDNSRKHNTIISEIKIAYTWKALVTDLF